MNYYLLGKRKGDTLEFKGNVAFLVVFVKELINGGTKYDELSRDEKKRAKKTIGIVEKYFMTEAKKRNVPLKIKSFYADAYSEQPIKFRDYESDARLFTSLLEQTKFIKMREAKEKGKGKFNETVIIFIDPSCDNERSYARTSTGTGREYVIVKDPFSVATYVHEICHVFGAKDYYFPEEVTGIALSTIGQNIMLDCTTMKIDDLTSYIIGWTPKLSPSAQAFVDQTDFMNEKYFAEKQKENAFTGKMRKESPGGIVYDGEFRNGQRHGYGVLSRNDKPIYEGNFKNGLYHGEGKLYINEDLVLIGIFNMGEPKTCKLYIKGKETDATVTIVK